MIDVVIEDLKVPDADEYTEMVRHTVSVTRLRRKRRPGEEHGEPAGFRVRLFVNGQNGGQPTLFKTFDVEGPKVELRKRLLEEYDEIFTVDINRKS